MGAMFSSPVKVSAARYGEAYKKIVLVRFDGHILGVNFTFS
jgi:hypothetical protein